MPNCFQLIKKGEEEPTVLQTIDDDLWNLFENSVPDPNTQWYRNWYNTIGLMLSVGRSFEEIRMELSDEMGPIISYLSENYTIRCWFEHK